MKLRQSNQLDPFWKGIIIASLLIALGSGIYTVTSKDDSNKVQTEQNENGNSTGGNQKKDGDKSIKSVATSFSKPTDAAKSVEQGIFYPADMPKGYTHNNDFEVINNNVVTYSVRDTKGNTYPVTQQPLQANFSQDTFAKNLTSITKFNTSVGNALIGKNRSELLASVEIPGKAWVIVNAPSPDLRTQLEAVVKSLKFISG